MSRQRHALLLGVNQYRDPEIHPLVAAKVLAMMSSLTKSGVHRNWVEPKQPFHGESWRQLFSFGAGHGFEVNHKHYLLTPADRIKQYDESSNYITQPFALSTMKDSPELHRQSSL